MVKKVQKASIVYCSPAGTTKHVGKVIGNKLHNMGIDPRYFDLGKKQKQNSLIDNIINKNKESILFIGSPVYASHSLPPVMDFISCLPEKIDIPVVLFVTWGGVTSGIALYEMGKVLIEKGINVVAGAKVLALHSIMWQCATQLGYGHPDLEDDKMVEDMVETILQKFASGSLNPIPLSDLLYYPDNIRIEMENRTLADAKPHMVQKQIDQSLCTQCKECQEACPTDSIDFSPYPEFKETCIMCFNCVKVCPEKAIKADLSGMEKNIKAKAKNFNERPFTQIFI